MFYHQLLCPRVFPALNNSQGETVKMIKSNGSCLCSVMALKSARFLLANNNFMKSTEILVTVTNTKRSRDLEEKKAINILYKRKSHATKVIIYKGPAHLLPGGLTGIKVRLGTRN